MAQIDAILVRVQRAQRARIVRLHEEAARYACAVEVVVHVVTVAVTVAAVVITAELLEAHDIEQSRELRGRR